MPRYDRHTLFCAATCRSRASAACSWSAFGRSSARESRMAGGASATGQGVAFERDVAFQGLLDKAKACGKPVFVDFATEDCVYCKKLDAEVLSRADVAEAMKAYVAAHVDAEKGEGKELAQRYKVHGFPTLLVVDDQCVESDRFVGYRTPESVVAEVKRIASGHGTIPTLRQQL